MSNLHEECGVFGIYSPETSDLASICFYGLFALQHRGQESCGMVVNDDGVFRTHKDAGIVHDIFTPSVMQKLGTGNMILGHVRYGTTKDADRANAQPVVVNHIKGHLALASNGSLVNYAQLRGQLEMDGSIFHSNGDGEVISYTIIKERLNSDSIEEAVSKAMDKLVGAYSLCIMSPQKLIAVRDEMGMRPLCYGRMPDGKYVVASESCALDAVGAKLIRDVRPGEIIIFDKNGVHSITDHCDKKTPNLCVFEYIYFARPDSVIEGSSVHEARVRAGSFLALEHPVQADVVIGVPDSGLDAAIGYAKQSGIPYELGFIKNRYIARTFIAPGQKSRENLVRIKLNPISNVVNGKRVVLIDDSIVRGTTSERIVRLLREAGATEIHMRVTAPPFLNPCYYGTDVDSRENLIACKYTTEEIAKIIGVDSLGFLNKDYVKLLAANSTCSHFCDACFTGDYPTEEPEKYINKYEKKLSEQ